MLAVIYKKIIGHLTNWSGSAEILPLNLNRDYSDINRLIEMEEWPITRSDFEVSHIQPKSTSFIAKIEGTFAGFFTTHNFGDIGYLDMMIIEKEFRKKTVARPLYFKTIREMKKKGLKKFVVHTTNDSARLIRLLGFKKGQSFTLYQRDPKLQQNNNEKSYSQEEIKVLGKEHIDSLVKLDRNIFGLGRKVWIESLMRNPDVEFLGKFIRKSLVASVCLRPRKMNYVCIDMVNAQDILTLEELLKAVVTHVPRKGIQCIVRDGSPLEKLLENNGFVVPDFFKQIGPLYEWTKGNIGNVGQSERIQCLTWM